MPLITNIIEFSPEENELIRQKLDSGTFSHSDWGNEELMPLRCKIRDYYRAEQRGVCAYCKKDTSRVSPANAHVEHIAPKSLHLKFIFEPKNLCVICADCNTIKNDQEVLEEIPDTFERACVLYPRSSGAFKIVHPFFDEYDAHILILGRLYINKTPKGNFTIGACNLNRYLQEFGVDEKFVDDEQLIEVMNNFIESGSSIQRAHELRKLQDMIITSIVKATVETGA
jgi:hypothetical protein